MNIVVNAGPGSGKSTTLEQAFLLTLTGKYHFNPSQEQVNICHAISSTFAGVAASQVVFIAFNTTTRDRLATRLPTSTKAYTFNGLGQSIIFKRHKHQKFDKLRGERLLATLLGRNLADFTYNQRLEYYSLLRYVAHCKEELLVPSEASFHFLQTKYNLTAPPGDIDLATRLMTSMTIPNGAIEFIDQVWMGLQAIQSPLYQVAFVDEAQDLSALRLEFACRVAHNVVFVGDPYQSINAFAGADNEAFEKIERVSAIKLPLLQSFRLPPNHIEHANTVRPARITSYKLEPGPIEAFSINDLVPKLRSFISGTTNEFTVRWRYNPAVYTKDPNPAPLPLPLPAPAPVPTTETQNSPTQPIPTGQLPTQPVSQLHPNTHSHSHTSGTPLTPPPRSSTPPPGTPYDPTTHLWTILPPQEMRDPSSHLMIGRTNAEIFQVAIHLIKHGIACRIIRRKEDQDILTTLRYYLDDKLKQLRTRTIPGLILLLRGDAARARSMPYKSGNVLYEKAQCLIHVCDIADSLESIPDVLEQLTSESTGCVRLCTIHKAKGMEAHFVYILFPPVAHPKAETPAEIEQEKNLEFVSETRSQFYKAYIRA